MKPDLLTKLLLTGILLTLLVLVFERTPARVEAQDAPAATPAATAPAPADAAALEPPAAQPDLDRGTFSNVIGFPVPGADYDTRHLVLVATPHKIAIVAVGPLGFHGPIKVQNW